MNKEEGSWIAIFTIGVLALALSLSHDYLEGNIIQYGVYDKCGIVIGTAFAAIGLILFIFERYKISVKWVMRINKGLAIGIVIGMLAGAMLMLLMIYEPVSTQEPSLGGGKPLSNDTWGEQSIPDSEGKAHLHPDVLYFPDGKAGYKFWMYYTPYPGDSAEDICLVRSNDGYNWTFSGTDNPITNNGNWCYQHHTADPDVLFIPEYNKFFMAFSAVNQVSPKQIRIAFAYSAGGINDTGYDGTIDTDRWILYNGAEINGNDNPVILYEEDSGSPSDEDLTVEPALYFDNSTELFYLFYRGIKECGNGESRICKATFEWNDSYNNIENFSRHGEVYYPSADSDFNAGIGHTNVFMWNGTMWMLGCRVNSATGTYELDLAKSNDMGNTWTREGKVLGVSASGWDSQSLYRSSFAEDGYGNLQMIDGKFWLYYTGMQSSTNRHIGLATTVMENATLVKV